MEPLDPNQLRLVANTIRGLAMDAVQKANSGHPGMPMGMADVAAVLWTRWLRWSAQDPTWRGRDRFVLSAGHGSMLLYSLLHLAGFDLTLEDLKSFRQLHSKTPGHPEYGLTPGVETTTGPLGAGFSNAVGMALAATMEAERFQNPDLRTRVIGICSDGDLMEGVTQEAASLAGHWKLSNLIFFYDDNGITIEGHTDLAFSDDTKKRFEALGWRVLKIDGHDFEQVDKALATATREKTRPVLIVTKTHIAQGAPTKHDTHEAHGAPLGDDEVAATKKALGMPPDAFWVAPEAKAAFAAASERNEKARASWQRKQRRWQKQSATTAAEHARFLARETPKDLLEQLAMAAGNQADATRNLSGKVIQKAAELVPSLVGGSADLDPSTKTKIKASTSVTGTDKKGRVLHFGIREHGMGGILNGMTLHGGFLPMGSTFLVFLRLHAADSSARGDHGHPHVLRVHARQPDGRRGRADASAGRASRRAAPDPEPAPLPPSRRPRDRGRVGLGAATHRRPGHDGADAPEPALADATIELRAARRPARRLRRARARAAPRRGRDRDRRGGRADDRRREALTEPRRRAACGLDALRRALPAAGRALAARRAAARAAGVRGGDGQARVLVPLHGNDSSASSASRPSGRRGRPRRSRSTSGLRVS